ncbi:unnamed protein product [Thelazia callipaeda]|uniref:V-type proton ATPase subunit G n=1 Tax=Thelazia callipaeda TaxID=103827 RepID=A0A0N5CTJ1_THECL|nr:unnamed protein product [Thelazia callipaeda]
MPKKFTGENSKAAVARALLSDSYEVKQVTQASIEARKRAEEERKQKEEKEHLLRMQRLEVEKEDIEENVNLLRVQKFLPLPLLFIRFKMQILDAY